MPKRSRSPHQKRIRFFTGLFVVTLTVVTVLLFWFANRGFAAH
jgi:hypothetical protein